MADIKEEELEDFLLADLVLIDLDPTRKILSVDIIELKRENIDLKAVGQVCRYKVGIKRFLKKTLPRIKYLRRFTVEINCHLIGKQYPNDDTCFVVDEMPNLKAYMYNIDLASGITIEQSSGWHNKKENFKSISEILRLLRDEHRSSMAAWLKHEYEQL
jgi:hypothetical protein